MNNINSNENPLFISDIRKIADLKLNAFQVSNGPSPDEYKIKIYCKI